MARPIPTLLCLALLSCDSGGGGGSEVTPAQACGALAQAACARRSACEAGDFIQRYGDMATCIAREEANCPALFGLPGTSLTPDRMQKCAQAYPSASCSDIFQNNPPAPCQPVPGKLADGATCGDRNQCQSTSCRGDLTTGCGKCTPRARDGESCTSAECGIGLLCNPQALCAPPADEGQSCMAATCKLGLLCRSNTCVRPLALDARCDPMAPACDVVAGQVCDKTSMTCQPRPYAKAGETCGPAVLCSGGAGCQFDTGTCRAPARDGEACDPINALNCLAPASCSGGTCRISDPTRCQ